MASPGLRRPSSQARCLHAEHPFLYGPESLEEPIGAAPNGGYACDPPRRLDHAPRSMSARWTHAASTHAARCRGLQGSRLRSGADCQMHGDPTAAAGYACPVYAAAQAFAATPRTDISIIFRPRSPAFLAA